MTHWILHSHAIHLRDVPPSCWLDISEGYHLEGIYYEGKREEHERGRSSYRADALEQFVALHHCDPDSGRSDSANMPENHADRLATLLGAPRRPWEHNTSSGVIVFAASHFSGISEHISSSYDRFEVWVA